VPYETGTWLNPSDGLDKLRVFLVAQGWIVDAFTVEAPGKRLHMHKGSFYLNAKSADDGSSNIWQTTWGQAMPRIGFNVGTGYNSSLSWRAQPGAVMDNTGVAIGCDLQLPAGAVIGYRFDYDDTFKSLVIYVQISTGIWRWAGFGESLTKAGAWTGGAWIASSSNYYWSSYGTNYPGHVTGPTAYPFGAHNEPVGAPLVFVRADVDSYTGKWVSCCPTDSTGKAGSTNVPGGGIAISTNVPSLVGLMDRCRNAMNSLTVLQPVQVFAVRDAGGQSLLGTLPNVYATNITGLVPGQSYQQGVDWFTPFPGDVATRGTVVKRR